MAPKREAVQLAFRELDIKSVCLWRKPKGAPDSEFIRIGDFADVGPANSWIRADLPGRLASHSRLSRRWCREHGCGPRCRRMAFQNSIARIQTDKRRRACLSPS